MALAELPRCWSGPCPSRESVDPAPATVIVARLQRPAAHRAARRTLLAASMASAVALVACKNADAPAATAGAQPASQRGDSMPNLPVVIARPSTRYQPDPAATG